MNAVDFVRKRRRGLNMVVYNSFTLNMYVIRCDQRTAVEVLAKLQEGREEWFL